MMGCEVQDRRNKDVFVVRGKKVKKGKREGEPFGGVDYDACGCNGMNSTELCGVKIKVIRGLLGGNTKEGV